MCGTCVGLTATTTNSLLPPCLIQGAYCSCQLQREATAARDDATPSEWCTCDHVSQTTTHSRAHFYTPIHPYTCAPIPTYMQSQNFTEVIIFSCRSRVACKTLWKSCVEHHSFFRYTDVMYMYISCQSHSGAVMNNLLLSDLLPPSFQVCKDRDNSSSLNCQSVQERLHL